MIARARQAEVAEPGRALAGQQDVRRLHVAVDDPAAVRVREPVAGQDTVTCVIPGHHRLGRELFSDSIAINAGPLVFSVEGRCAYETTFEYSSDDR